jgi:hypothetical protein
MVSTVKPKYLTFVSIQKPLCIAILVLALVRLVHQSEEPAQTRALERRLPGNRHPTDRMTFKRFPCMRGDPDWSDA